MEDLAHMLRVRRRLRAEVDGSMGGSGSGAAVNDTIVVEDVAGSMAELSDEEADQAFTSEQLVALRVSGWLAVSLYTLLALVIVYMSIQHFRHRSTARKKVFHLLLLTSVLFNLPDPLGWLLWPESESWKYTYPLRIYSLLLQSVCKSFISIAWSEVVSAGQTFERRRVTTLVKVFNGILLCWGISVPFLLAKYPNDVYGQYDFMQSTLRGIVTYSGIGVIFVYGLILTYQGMRLRRRLVLAKGTVPLGSVEKSLSQLMLTVYVIVFSDLMRIGSLIMYEMKVDMPMTTFLVCNNLIPNIFPTICMLYLMRRYTKRATSPPDTSNPFKNHAEPHVRRRQFAPDATLSRFMTEERDSMDENHRRSSSTPVLGQCGKFALPTSRMGVASIDLEQRPHPQLVDSRRSQQASLTPTSYWVRE